MPYLKLLTAPLIIIAGLALLTACGGVSPTVNIGELTINNNGNPCDTQPFGDDCGADYDAARVTKIGECLKGKAASTPTCKLAIMAHSCIDNPFATACASDTAFAAYFNTARTERTTYCQANPDETAFCAEFVEFNRVCGGNTDIFNTRCSNDSAGRTTACLANGIGTGGHATCAGILVTPCMNDPFTNSHCDDATDISGIRTRYCGDPATAWDDDCVVATYSGTKDARDMACLQYGIDANAGGDATCAMRPNVLEACGEDSPFAHPVCDEVVGIDAGFRTTFCQIPASAFTTGCEQGTHGEVDTIRDRACLDGLSTATGCGERPNVTRICTDDPLSSDNPGCTKLPDYNDFLSTYCEFESRVTTIGGCGTNATNVCPTNLFNPSAISRTGTIDCLNDMDYAPARITACSTGAELNNCDTAEIAPEVCKASGASANPFAVFCATATNIGGGDIAMIRQDALDACPDGTQDGNVGVCQNTISIRATLNADCAMVANAFTDRCNYTQYVSDRRGFCNNQATAWNTGCDDETTYTSTPALRDAACLADSDADMGYTGSDTRCGARMAIILACPADDPFARPVCDKVAGIDTGFRTTYCAMPANVFKTKCKTDGTHGDVSTAQRDACLKFGTDTGMGGHGSCIGNTLAESSCEANPFDDTKPGCAILTEFPMIVETFCDMNQSNPNCTVKTSAWVRSFGEGKAPPARLTATTPATERKRQFLTGLATGLDTTGTFQTTILDYQKFTLTLDSAMYSGEPLGGDGDPSDGVAAFFDTVDTETSSRVYYAGILLNTDLGSPLTQTDGSVTWYGQIQIFREGFLEINNDFVLEITFGMKSGVADSVGSIEGFVERTLGSAVSQYLLVGSYDAGGVITGRVTFVRFTGANTGQLSRAVANGDNGGILTGLIGEQGAVGVFILAEAGSTKDNIEGDANANQIYAGGFVAAPYIPAEEDDIDKVTFRDWLRKFNYPLHTSPVVITAGSTAPSHFIKPKAGEMLADNERLDLTGVILATPYTVRRAGDAKDGFVYTAGTIDGRVNSFAGILPSTDLGAPLIDEIVTIWPGQFSLGNLETLHDIDFTLTFDGTNMGTINGMVGHVTFALFFDDKGIVTGDVTSTGVGFAGEAPARGLIGEEGLVGVFANINGSESAHNLFGGFVAAPRVTNQAAWRKSFSGGVPATLTSATSAANRKRQFLAGGETALSEDDTIGAIATRYGLTFASAMYNGAALIGNNDAKDGFAGFVDPVVSGSNHIYYAGILSGTDLGKPLKETAGSFTWNGQIQIVRNNAADISTDFSLEITLGAVNGVEDSLGAIYGIVQSSGTNHYELTGTYNAGGIITGEVTYAAFTGSPLDTAAPVNGILSGLIGQQGAVGVFLRGSAPKETIGGGSSATDIYAGGFVVSGAPPPRQSVVQPADTDANQVTFKDWLRDFGGFPPPDRLTAPPRERKREFLAGGTERLTTRGSVNVTKTVTANLGTGNTGDGYHYFVDTVALNTRIPYAGLLSGTDLGARVTGTAGTTAEWNGTLRAHTNLTVDVNTPLKLKITYGGTNGEMGSIAGAVRTFTTTGFELKGTYDASGVISGTVYHGAGFPSTGDVTRTATNTNGILTGLIGAQGAVGVFLSGTGTKGDITVGVGSNYVGGFVVKP